MTSLPEPPVSHMSWAVAALYHFARVERPGDLRGRAFAVFDRLGLCGTLLVAHEGINGTLAGTAAAIDSAIAMLRHEPGFAGLEVKYSTATSAPFHRLKVRVKAEIVTMGQPDLDPVNRAGTYVEPQDWNALIADPDTIVIDTRNGYEVGIGTFDGAINPETESFRAFPDWFSDHRDQLLGDGAPKKVAMFCTGGIRCEKATAFLKAEGIQDVFHLRGGILKYLETVPEGDSRWQGECFVFDERVSVGHGLEVGDHTLCRACRMPVTTEGRASPHYVEGIACERCYRDRTVDQKRAYAERHRQTVLAEQRGIIHIGRVSGRQDHTGGPLASVTDSE